MKMFKYILATLMLCVVCACNHRGTTEFELRCSFDGIMTDSVTLLTVEEDYNMLRQVAASAVKEGSATLRGQLDAPAIGMLKINRVEQPFYFIVEPGKMQLHFTREHTLAHCGVQNHHYAEYEQLLGQLQQQRSANRKQYLKHAGDSSLTSAMEVKMQRLDSVLCDSVQRMTVRMINAGGPVGRLIREQHYGVLDSLNRNKILIKKTY